jgi:hypothetical protein
MGRAGASAHPWFLAGERESTLLEGLDATDTTIVRRILTALANQPGVDTLPSP